MPDHSCHVDNGAVVCQLDSEEAVGCVLSLATFKASCHSLGSHKWKGSRGAEEASEKMCTACVSSPA